MSTIVFDQSMLNKSINLKYITFEWCCVFSCLLKFYVVYPLIVSSDKCMLFTFRLYVWLLLKCCLYIELAVMHHLLLSQPEGHGVIDHLYIFRSIVIFLDIIEEAFCYCFVFPSFLHHSRCWTDNPQALLSLTEQRPVWG